MAAASTKGEDDGSFFAFCSARKEHPSWFKALPEDFYYMLRVCSKTIATPFQCSMACVLAAVSSLATRRTLIEITPRWKLKPNMFLLCASHMGFGKTQGYTKIFAGPIGLLNFMEANECRCTGIAGDELVPFLLKMYLSRSDEFQCFRGFANTTFGGGNYRKKLGSKSYNITDPVLSMFGITQPKPCTSFVKGLAKLEDGSVDRWMVMTAGLEAPDNEPEHIVAMIAGVVDADIVQDDFYKLYLTMLLNIADILERNPAKRFVIDDEGSQAITDIAHDFRQDAMQAIALVDVFLDKCKKKTLEADDDKILEPRISKSIDYVVKFAWCLSIIRKCFGTSKSQMNNDVDFWTISKADVEHASDIVGLFDKQRKIYMESGGNLWSQIRDTDLELAQNILKLKGNVFTSTMVARNTKIRQWLNFNRLGSSDITRMFKVLDGARKEGQPEFVGSYVYRERHHIFTKDTIPLSMRTT